MEKYNAGDVVKITSNGAIGAVLRALHNHESVSYEVLVNGEKLILECTQIKKIEETSDCFENREAFDEAITSLAIRNPGKELFSLNSAKIDFIPYQYRPVLKIIKSDQPRILIADDVGVGKTIEAGLIIKELSARQSMKNIMIFCPRPLVAEGKWKNEMHSKFNEKFQHLDRKTLKNAIKECDYEGEWIDDYGRCIIPYSILDEELLTGKDSLGKKEIGLFDLKPAPRFDLVIVDEAHHIRNQNTQAYKVIQYFCMHAEAVVFLTATPIQMGNYDLFVLLNLLRPDYILDRETFNIMSEPNPFINGAINILRQANEKWKDLAIESLELAKCTEWSIRTNLANEINSLQQKIIESPNTPESRVSFIADLEKLHTFSNIINRTRKRDIGNFTIRKPQTVRSSFSEKQQALYDGLIEVQTKILSMKYEESMIKFLMSTLYRQAASCIFGLSPFIEDILSRHIVLEDFLIEEVDNGNDFEINDDIQKEIRKVLMLAKEIDDTDHKYELLKKIVSQKQSYSNNKIMIFSTFRHTLRYLYLKLQHEGYRVGIITGAVKDEERLFLRERFQLPKNNDNTIDIMLFSEVGCEGLDYQFCDCIINYDLPWNPMRIEQRIGRIDRNGQRSESILIYNMITNGTIDADIYDRCLFRIGIFSQSLGCGEEILGEISKEIHNIAVDYKLSSIQKEEKLRQLADNKIRLINENQIMEENQYDFLSIRMPYEEDKRRIQEFTNFWLTSEKIENLIQRYIWKKFSKKIIEYSNQSYEIRFTKEEKNELLTNYYAIKSELLYVDKSWITFLKNDNNHFRYTFSAELAKEKNMCLMTTIHPLVLLASRIVIDTNQVVIKYHSTEYAGRKIGFSIYEWRYVGDRNISQLKIISDQNDVKDSIEMMIKEGDVIKKDYLDNLDNFSGLHGKLWAIEREKYKAKQLEIYSRRQESLRLGYKKRLAVINKQEVGTDNVSIKRMKRKEHENVVAELEYRLKQLENQKDKIDIISKFVCAGIIIVEE